MMAEFINGLTGTHMWVAPEREAEYRLAGHKPVEKDAAGARTAPAGTVKAAGQAGRKRIPARK